MSPSPHASSAWGEGRGEGQQRSWQLERSAVLANVEIAHASITRDQCRAVALGAGQKPAGRWFQDRAAGAVGPFFSDFLCREKRIVIELDGETHDSDVRQAADQERTNELSAMGYEVLRVSNEDVLSDVSKVVARFLERLKEVGR